MNTMARSVTGVCSENKKPRRVVGPDTGGVKGPLPVGRNPVSVYNHVRYHVNPGAPRVTVSLLVSATYERPICVPPTVLRFEVAPPAGFGPATRRLVIGSSIPLSYGGAPGSAATPSL